MLHGEQDDLGLGAEMRDVVGRLQAEPRAHRRQ